MHHDSHLAVRSENPSLYPPTSRPAPSASPLPSHFTKAGIDLDSQTTRLPRGPSLLAPYRSTSSPRLGSTSAFPHAADSHNHNSDPSDAFTFLRLGHPQYHHPSSSANVDPRRPPRDVSPGNRSYVDRWSSSTNSSVDNAVSVPLSHAPAAPRSPTARQTPITTPHSTSLPASTTPSFTPNPSLQKHKHTRTNSGILGHFAKFATSPEINHPHAGSHTPQPPGSPGARFQSHYRPIAARVATNLHIGSRGLLPAGPQVTDSIPPRPSAAMVTTMPPSDEGHLNGDEHLRGHSRNRSGKSSADSSKARAPKPPSQKAMLSRALQKANSAVLLDNNQDFRGARQAYAEACELLHQVLQRTSGDEDKRKLEAIRRTYSSRISELDQMLSLWHNGKSLPAYPDEELSNRRTIIQHAPEHEADPTAVEMATLRRIGRDDNQTPHAITHTNTHTQHHQYQHQQQPRQDHRPPRLQSPDTDPIHSPEHGFLHSSFNRTPVRSRFPDHVMSSAMNASSTYAPQHVPPTTMQAPQGLHGDGLDGPVRTDFSAVSETRRVVDHTRENSQSSWLDPIDESGGSNASSVHSRTSSLGYRRRHIRAGSGNTEAEFDTALDAAIEAAYDEGYEPMDDDDVNAGVPDEEVVANALRKVEIARERVRQTEREAYEVASEQERQRLMLLQHPPVGQTERYHAHQGQDYFFDDNSSDDEERILDEITRGLASQDLPTHGQAQAFGAESSGQTTNAWHGSAGSNALASNTSLSTVSESMPAPYIPSGPALAPPPTHALPDLPSDKVSSALAGNTNRRQSTQNYKQLKIETKRLVMPDTASNNETPQAKVVSTDKGDIQAVELTRPTTASQQPPSAEISPTDPRTFGSPPDNRPDGEESSTGRSGSPTSNKLKKNFSSSSLRSLKARNLSVSNLDESEISPGAAMGGPWGLNSRPPAMPVMPTPLAATLRDRAETAVGGLFLLDHHFHSPDSPGSPNPTVSEAPVPLEPCPTDFMLRPFWLMRCLYQTLVHPRGGYLSLKLFVPREAWRVKGVKLKNMEDKIANCDFLTAALLKLAQVDTFDADALLEEMQALENILEQTQAALTRKLGNEVGIHSTNSLFKDGLGGTDGDSGAMLPRSSSVSGKSSFSWRRLRPKNSSSALGNAHHPARGVVHDANKDSIPTLPMTAQPTSRPARRDTNTAHFTGPNAQYMGSLARLFDAVQVIDQIARQVEDPGLRHADKTQVGLELSARHAAEFFAFYICRFVLSDLGLLMDKFIKRGTEWVLA